jgi:carbon storage regulator CsrA
MLVLSRKVGEEVYIGDNIRIVVNRISSNRVTIGISAPDNVHIVRGELMPVALSADGTGAREDLLAAM